MLAEFLQERLLSRSDRFAFRFAMSRAHGVEKSQLHLRVPTPGQNRSQDRLLRRALGLPKRQLQLCQSSIGLFRFPKWSRACIKRRARSGCEIAVWEDSANRMADARPFEGL